MKRKKFDEITNKVKKSMKGQKWGKAKKLETMLERIELCRQIKEGVGNGNYKD